LLTLSSFTAVNPILKKLKVYYYGTNTSNTKAFEFSHSRKILQQTANCFRTMSPKPGEDLKIHRALENIGLSPLFPHWPRKPMWGHISSRKVWLNANDGNKEAGNSKFER